jgi:prolipoprotein diacylglyceryltransferase
VNPAVIVGGVVAWYALLTFLVEGGRAHREPMPSALRSLVAWTSSLVMLFAGVGFVIGLCVGMYALGGKESAADAASCAFMLWSVVVGVGADVAGRVLIARGSAIGEARATRPAASADVIAP